MRNVFLYISLLLVTSAKSAYFSAMTDSFLNQRPMDEKLLYFKLSIGRGNDFHTWLNYNRTDSVRTHRCRTATAEDRIRLAACAQHSKVMFERYPHTKKILKNFTQSKQTEHSHAFEFIAATHINAYLMTQKVLPQIVQYQSSTNYLYSMLSTLLVEHCINNIPIPPEFHALMDGSHNPENVLDSTYYSYINSQDDFVTQPQQFFRLPLLLSKHLLTHPEKCSSQNLVRFLKFLLKQAKIDLPPTPHTDDNQTILHTIQNITPLLQGSLAYTVAPIIDFCKFHEHLTCAIKAQPAINKEARDVGEKTPIETATNYRDIAKALHLSSIAPPKVRMPNIAQSIERIGVKETQMRIERLLQNPTAVPQHYLPYSPCFSFLLLDTPSIEHNIILSINTLCMHLMYVSTPFPPAAQPSFPDTITSLISLLQENLWLTPVTSQSISHLSPILGMVLQKHTPPTYTAGDSISLWLKHYLGKIPLDDLLSSQESLIGLTIINYCAHSLLLQENPQSTEALFHKMEPENSSEVLLIRHKPALHNLQLQLSLKFSFPSNITQASCLYHTIISSLPIRNLPPMFHADLATYQETDLRKKKLSLYQGTMLLLSQGVSKHIRIQHAIRLLSTPMFTATQTQRKRKIDRTPEECHQSKKRCIAAQTSYAPDQSQQPPTPILQEPLTPIIDRLPFKEPQTLPNSPLLQEERSPNLAEPTISNPSKEAQAVYLSLNSPPALQDSPNILLDSPRLQEEGSPNLAESTISNPSKEPQAVCLSLNSPLALQDPPIILPHSPPLQGKEPLSDEALRMLLPPLANPIDLQGTPIILQNPSPSNMSLSLQNALFPEETEFTSLSDLAARFD